jgi:hypothetical protein
MVFTDERAFIIWEHGKKSSLYGYCKEAFPDLKLKGFEVRTKGIVYCDPTIVTCEMNLDGGKERTYEDIHADIYADAHETIIPFHEFVSGDQNERVFELINKLAQENIGSRPIFKDDTGTIQPFALLEDWEEANGGSIDVKKITGDYLASKVREYIRIYRGKIMSSSFEGKRKRLPVKKLISEYYEPSLEKHRIG